LREDCLGSEFQAFPPPLPITITRSTR